MKEGYNISGSLLGRNIILFCILFKCIKYNKLKIKVVFTVSLWVKGNKVNGNGKAQVSFWKVLYK